MLEWEFYQRTKSQNGFVVINWRFNGELPLNLSLESDYNGIPTRFELARFLSHPIQVEDMITNSSDRAAALEAIAQGQRFIDVFWDSYSPEELEDYFRKYRLPLPPGYKEEFDRLDNH